MSNNIKDKIIKLAFSLHSSPGIYALLLGSGVSRAAGIPTGWEIVLDLIQKVAAIEGEAPDRNPETWYRKRFGEAPDYSKLLDRLSTTPTERASLLRPYFEPTEEEQEQGLKMPTQAHKAIATLVKYGYIRTILTTNFDRLIEKALEEQSITPDVISTDDALKGAMPYVHSKCTVIKLHGDYMDTRIRNTAKELAHYLDELNAHLDRILDDFGLIVCGWSGEWDIALRNAILRCKNRRLPTYWLAKGELTDEAKRIIQHRRAELISIDSANQFFTELCEKINSLREFEKPHPLSYTLAKVTVKRYLSERKYKIRLFDLVNEEIERVFSILSSDHFKTQGVDLDKESFSKRMHEYEETIKILIGTLATIAYFDEKGSNTSFFTQALERLSKSLRRDGTVALINLQYYPCLLLIYVTGIVALVRKNWRILKAIFLDPVYREYDKRQSILEIVNISYIFGEFPKDFIPRDNAAREFTPANNYIFEFLYEHIKEFIPDKNKYEDIFDIFEFLSGLIYMYSVYLLYGDENTKKSFGTEEFPWAPVVRFGWRYFGFRSRREWKSSPIEEFSQGGLKQGENWGLLKEGFFDHSIKVFNLCYEKYLKFLTKLCTGIQ